MRRLPELTQLLTHAETERQLLATQEIREMLSTELNAPVDEAVSRGRVIPIFVAFLQRTQEPRLQVCKIAFDYYCKCLRWGWGRAGTL
jgi:hypothetical protein